MVTVGGSTWEWRRHARERSRTQEREADGIEKYKEDGSSVPDKINNEVVLLLGVGVVKMI